MRRSIHLAFVLFAIVCPLSAQRNAATPPRDVTYCELSRDPAAYNHQLVRVTAFVTHGFEDFHIAEPDCPTQGFNIWLMYGGKAKSNTMYCCPGESSGETRPEPLSVEGLLTSLVDDPVFHQFTELLNKEPDTIVRTTVAGRFYSGRRILAGGSAFWQGFGHMGCCSLLVVERIESFEPHTRSDLDYTAEAGWYEDAGCKWATEQDRRHVAVDNWQGEGEKAIVEQEAADGGQAWQFNDPQRVAIESLKPLYPGQVPALKNVKKTSVREVFQWAHGRNSMVTVVVTRPYWLSFYAASNSVAWVSTMIKEVGCE